MVAPSEPWQASREVHPEGPSSAREAPLLDPYVGKPPPPPPKPPLAPAALAAAILSLLPIGSVASIPVGVVGLRQTRLGTLGGRWLAIASIAAGALASLAYGGAAALFAIDYANAERRREAIAEERRERRRERELEEQPVDKDRVVPAPLITPRPSADPAAGDVPPDTKVTNVGAITVVDLGHGEPSLKQALVRELATARSAGGDVLVMTMDATCEPCKGVMRSLADPRLQAALEKIRLVRVDLGVFKSDVSQLGLQTVPYPVYALLAPDGSPRDAIDGGEWNEDVAENIAPVLGPFVKGDYKKRKKAFRPGPGGGVFL